MPELPDVETFKKYIDSTSLNKKISKIKIKNSKILENISKKNLTNKLENTKFISTDRHGKYLFIENNKHLWLVIHFGMTGDAKYFKNIDSQPSYSRLLITFENGYYFAFDNQRLLGKISLTDNKKQYIKNKNLGIDALELDFDKFKDLLENRRGMIKSTLMNQKIISGIGNIYADEILFQSGVHPKTKTSQINKNKLKDIYHNIDEVLKEAINNQANPDDFPDNYIIPHRRKHGNCPKGGEELKTIKVNGRNSYFCPVHQKKK